MYEDPKNYPVYGQCEECHKASETFKQKAIGVLLFPLFLLLKLVPVPDPPQPYRCEKCDKVHWEI